MSLAIELHQVRKSYGNVHALRGVDLSVPEGGIFGLVGPNGAGKTTLYSVVCGFLIPDAGTVKVAGHEVRTGHPPKRGTLAVLPQDAAFPKHITLVDMMTYYARLGGMDKPSARKEAFRVLELVGLGELTGRQADALSHGQRKRVGIAQAFVGSPGVIMLDEPTAGLDPHVAKEVRTTLRTIRDEQTVIVSSHNLGEVEDLCTEVAILHKGQVVRQESVDSLVGTAAEISFRMTTAPDDGVIAALGGLEFVTESAWDKGTSRLRVSFDSAQKPSDEAGQQLVAFLVQKGVAFVEMQVGKRLEDRFLEETR